MPRKNRWIGSSIISVVAEFGADETWAPDFSLILPVHAPAFRKELFWQLVQAFSPVQLLHKGSHSAVEYIRRREY